jgi:hypothetical protein
VRGNPVPLGIAVVQEQREERGNSVRVTMIMMTMIATAAVGAATDIGE